MKKLKTIQKIDTVLKIEYIMNNVCSISKDRIEAIVLSMHDEEDCGRLLRRFSEFYNDLLVESDILIKHKETYNKQYTSKVNGMYLGAYETMVKAKKQLIFLYHLMNKFAKKPVQSNVFLHTTTDNIEFVAEHSMFGLRPIQLEAFKDMSLVRRRLVEEIANFLNRLDGNLKICIDVIKEENAKKGNIRELIYLFEKQVNETYDSVKNFNRKRKIESKCYYDLLNYKNDPTVLPEYFHNISNEQMAYVAYGLKEQQLADYTPLQRKVFAEDVTKMDRFKFIVTHIDSLFGKITGELLCYIYKYTECEKSHSSFLKCFAETYTSHGGKYKVVSAVALSDAFTNATSNDYEGYNAFRSKIDDSLLIRPLSSQDSNSYQYSTVSQ